MTIDAGTPGGASRRHRQHEPHGAPAVAPAAAKEDTA